jgi:hypothetical protein
VRNSFDGGYGGIVKVDGVARSSPYQTTWELGNHTVEAYQYQQQKEYWFSYWSDDGNRAHNVNATLDGFGLVLTAYYSGPHKSSGEGMPTAPVTASAYPNPFNPVTTIQYSLPNGSFTTMEVYNVLGEKVTTLVKEEMAAGNHKVQFDATNLPSGMYFYRLSARGETHIEKLLLSK